MRRNPPKKIEDVVARSRRSGLWALKRFRRDVAWYVAQGISEKKAREFAQWHLDAAKKFYVRAGKAIYMRGEYARRQAMRSHSRKKKGDPDRLHLLAVKEFGETNDPYSAGFVMSDGTMLDLSVAGARTRDHREAGNLLDEAGYKPVDETAYGSRTQNLYLFMRETGAIRFSRSLTDDWVTMQVEKKPTAAQCRVVAAACRGASSVRISYGQDREMVEIDPATPGRVREVLESI